jgi:hypothetical protein
MTKRYRVRRILLAEDDNARRRFHREGAPGMQASTSPSFDNGLSAYNRLREERVRACADRHYVKCRKGMESNSLCRAHRARNPDIKVMFITGFPRRWR